MNDYAKIQGTIEFIEQNLKADINLAVVAESSGYSVPHFYRLFSAIVKLPVMEYIRKRKLSMAMRDIVLTKRRILDIALDYGFESHETFLRAFSLMYQLPPSVCRKNGELLSEFRKMEVVSMYDQYVLNILPEIVDYPTILLCGIGTSFTQREQLEFGLIEQFHQEFLDKLQLLGKASINRYFNVYEYDHQEILKNQELTYEYFIGLPYEESIELSKHLRLKSIPQTTYAKFTYHLRHKTLNEIPFSGSIYDYIDGIWLPHSSYRLSEFHDFEIVDKTNHTVEYYISIQSES